MDDSSERPKCPKPPLKKVNEFRKGLESAINRASKENGSNTPDFILAEYLEDCLSAFDKASRAREKWYGKDLKIEVDTNLKGE